MKPRHYNRLFLFPVLFLLALFTPSVPVANAKPTATVAVGNCNLAFNFVGAKTLTATYVGDSNFNGSTSAGVIPTVSNSLYLPLVQRNYTPPAPDLIVQTLTATTNGIQMIVKNQGNAPVLNEFWVDVYINPNPVPTQVNQTWDQLCSQGMVWGVTATGVQTLSAGGTLPLTKDDPYYRSDLSSITFPLAIGTKVYAQVDSANPNTNYGAVLENHEITGSAYNNISSTTVSTGSAPIPKVSTPTAPTINLPIQPLPPRK